MHARDEISHLAVKASNPVNYVAVKYHDYIQQTLQIFRRVNCQKYALLAL